MTVFRTRLPSLDRAVAKGHSCQKVRLSVCRHTGEPRGNGSRYRDSYAPYDMVMSVVFALNFAVVSLGVRPKRVR